MNNSIVWDGVLAGRKVGWMMAGVGWGYWYVKVEDMRVSEEEKARKVVADRLKRSKKADRKRRWRERRAARALATVEGERIIVDMEEEEDLRREGPTPRIEVVRQPLATHLAVAVGGVVGEVDVTAPGEIGTVRRLVKLDDSYVGVVQEDRGVVPNREVMVVQVVQTTERPDLEEAEEIVVPRVPDVEDAVEEMVMADREEQGGARSLMEVVSERPGVF